MVSSPQQRVDDFAKAMNYVGLTNWRGRSFVLDMPTKPFSFGRAAVKMALSQITSQDHLEVQARKARKS